MKKMKLFLSLIQMKKSKKEKDKIYTLDEALGELFAASK